MFNLFKKFSLYYILVGALFVAIKIAFFTTYGYTLALAVTLNALAIVITLTVILIFWFVILNKVNKKNEEAQQKRETEFQQSIKNIYDENIFSITHELRSPLAVIAASAINQMNNLRSIYKHLQAQIESGDGISKQNVVNIKSSIRTIQEQVEIIEDFIASIVDHSSYVNSANDEKIVSIYQYMISILGNSGSFSRNMRVFKNNIMFGDGFGRDFQHIQLVVNPHDLSRIIMNVMNNAADAVNSAYKYKKESDPNYEPSLKVRCLKSTHFGYALQLNKDFVCINGNKNEFLPFYLVIQDNGPGITKDHLKRIFKYGYSTKREIDKAHYGLGLHVCLRLAQRNNLKIFIKTGPEGTMFVIGFPTMLVPDDASKLYCSRDSQELFIECVEKEAEFSDSGEEVFVYFEKEGEVETDFPTSITPTKLPRIRN